MELDYFIYLVSDTEYRIQRSHGLLEDHGNIVSSDVLHCFDGSVLDLIGFAVSHVQSDASLYDLTLGSLKELHYRQAGYGLAASGFSYYADGSTLRHLKGYAVNSFGSTYVSKEIRMQVFYLKNVVRIFHRCQIFLFRYVLSLMLLFEFVGYLSVFLSDPA